MRPRVEKVPSGNLIYFPGWLVRLFKIAADLSVAGWIDRKHALPPLQWLSRRVCRVIPPSTHDQDRPLGYYLRCGRVGRIVRVGSGNSASKALDGREAMWAGGAAPVQHSRFVEGEYGNRSGSRVSLVNGNNKYS